MKSPRRSSGAKRGLFRGTGEGGIPLFGAGTSREFSSSEDRRESMLIVERESRPGGNGAGTIEVLPDTASSVKPKKVGGPG